LANISARLPASKSRVVPYALAACLLAIVVGGLLWHRGHAAGKSPSRRDAALVGGNSQSNTAVAGSPKAANESRAQPEQDSERENAKTDPKQRNEAPAADLSSLQELQTARRKEFDEYRASTRRRTEDRDQVEDEELRSLLNEISDLKRSIAASRVESGESRALFEKELGELNESIARLREKIRNVNVDHDKQAR